MPIPTKPTRPPVPYPAYRFRLRMGARVVAGLSRCSAVEDAVSRERPPSPADARRLDAITLEAGVTNDRDLVQWARLARGRHAAPPPDRLLRDLAIDVLDEAGRRIASYRARRAWVSEFRALPDLDAGANAVAIEALRIESEGWERDDDDAEPAVP